MTKKIFIVRHAKSSWSDYSLTDKERPLNNRGKKNAPEMAAWCVKKGYIPQQMISSTAVRAKLTAKVFKNDFNIADSRFRLEDRLYHAPAQMYMEACFGLEESIESVMLFGHNPGITYLANEVSDEYIENIPTCGILIIECNAHNWQSVDFSNCKLINWTAPKLI